MSRSTEVSVAMGRSSHMVVLDHFLQVFWSLPIVSGECGLVIVPLRSKAPPHCS